MKVEMLIIINGHKEFCEELEHVMNYLKSLSSLAMSDSCIGFKNSQNNFIYNIRKVEFNDDRYFNLEIKNTDTNDVKIKEFTELISLIKEHFNKGSDKRVKVYSIWDDISYHYSLLSYPLINELENTMRKMILKFMLKGVGVDWYEKITPDTLKQKIDRRNNGNIFQNVLWEMDFIHLSNFLFENSRLKSLPDLDRILSTSSEKIDKRVLNDFILDNNWNRYFKNHIKFDEVKLKEIWGELYELRNKVAHNRGVNLSDYELIKTHSSTVVKIINEAIEVIEKGTIVLTEQQKEDIKNIIDNESQIRTILKESKEWHEQQIKTHPNTFIGYNFFLNKCGERGVEREKTIEILSKLEKDGVIETYHHERSYGDFAIKSIRIL